MTPDEKKERFETWYEASADRVRNVLFRYCGSKELDDLVQETWCKVWGSMDRFRGESAAETWVIRIGINVAKNYLRKSKPLLGIKLLEDTARHGSFELTLSSIVDLERSMKKLKKKDLDIVVLFFLEDLSLKETASILDTKVGSLGTRIFKIRQQLRADMKECKI